MRIAYFDEAGVAHEAQEPYLVVGGVLIHGDQQWQPVEYRAKKIIETHVPEKFGSDFAFHAMHLFYLEVIEVLMTFSGIGTSQFILTPMSD
jgi:hypothetical protein